MCCRRRRTPTCRGSAGRWAFPAWPTFTPTDPLLDEVWGLLSEAKVPVVVHAGHAPVGTDHTGPAPFGRLMARYPDLTAIVAHLGAPDYGEFLRLAEEYEQVRLDTTMVFTGFFDRLAPFPDALLRAVCWDNPVGLFGLPQTAGVG